MRSALLTAAAAAAAVLAVRPAAAGPPPGTYQRSCSDIRIQGRELVADCDKKGFHFSNGSRTTRLMNWEHCVGDIANIDGRLRCRRPANLAVGPRGTYRHSCEDIHTIGGVLYAKCPQDDRRYRYWGLPGGNECRGDVANRNGTLRCEVGMAGAGAPNAGGGRNGGPIPGPVGPTMPAPLAGKPVLTVTPNGSGSFVVHGMNFSPNAQAFIRVVDGWRELHPALTARTSPQGTFSLPTARLCMQPGALSFTAHDGRYDRMGFDGKLWSDAAIVPCT